MDVQRETIIPHHYGVAGHYGVAQYKKHLIWSYAIRMLDKYKFCMYIYCICVKTGRECFGFLNMAVYQNLLPACYPVFI